MGKRRATTKTDTRTTEQAMAAWPEKKRLLLDELPKHDFDWFKAGIAAGYKQTYAGRRLKGEVTKDVTFCTALLERRKQLEARTTDKRDKVERYLMRVVDSDDAKIQHRDKIAACQTLSRMNGWDQQTIVLERGERQRELDQSRQTEARLLAALRFNTIALPGDSASNTSKALSLPAAGETTTVFEAKNAGDSVRKVVTNAEQSPGAADDSTVPAAGTEQACAGFDEPLQQPGVGQDGQDSTGLGTTTPMPPSGPAADRSPPTPEFFGDLPKVDSDNPQ